MKKLKPQLIAIVGGSGVGKSWLADKLQQSFGEDSTRVSLDDFYLDRSHLPAKRRSRINFDHPRAIDWKNVEDVLRKFASGRAARMPQYDFTTHARAKTKRWVKPKPVIIMDGLWLLRRPLVRRFFSVRVFVACSKSVCLRRRLKRDLAQRGRQANEVREQFLNHVAPMQERFVDTQLRWANLVVRQPGETQISQLTKQLKTLLENK